MLNYRMMDGETDRDEGDRWRDGYVNIQGCPPLLCLYPCLSLSLSFSIYFSLCLSVSLFLSVSACLCISPGPLHAPLPHGAVRPRARTGINPPGPDPVRYEGLRSKR
eukprot:sb/3477722/